MSNIDTKYIELCKAILAKGNVKSDRTGTGTISLFGAEIRHDLQESFPLLTTKSVHFKSVVGELLWILSGTTNIKFLTDNGIRIWNEWADKDGEIGMLYPAAWRYWYSPSNDLVQVKRRTDKYEDYKYPYNTEFLPKIDCEFNSDEMWAVKNLGAKSRNTRYIVQMKSGFLLEISRPNWKLSKSVSNIDKYHKGAHGAGFLGDYEVWDERTYNLWYNMIARCYNNNHPTYRFYGGAGVTVSPIWLSYHKFYETLSQLAGFTFWKDGANLELDKDYFGSKVYSPSTCIFVPKSHNSGIRPDGTVIEIQGKKYSSIMEWSGHRKSLSWYANKRWKEGLSYKGIDASEVNIVQPDDGMLWRKRIYVDQISDLIDGLKNNPNSRRHLVTAWNPSFLPFQSLPSCHYSFQCYVNDGKLSLMFNMRSNDFFLGNPFNIASYALLTHMLAQVCNLEVGELIWRGGDVHIYQNHIEQIKTQIARYENGEVFEAPTLVLNKGVTDIDDFTFDDIQLINYKNAGKLTGEVAI